MGATAGAVARHAECLVCMVWAQNQHTSIMAVGGGIALPYGQHFMPVAILKATHTLNSKHVKVF